MKRILGVVVLLLALLAAFSLLSFRLMSSQTVRDSSIASSHSTSSDGSAVQPPAFTTVRMEGGNRLAQPVQKALLDALKERPMFGAFWPEGSNTDPASDAVLTVTVEEQKYFWSPVYARSGLAVKVAYASNGDVAFRDQDPPVFRSSSDRPAIQLLATYALADVSWGLISRPGYNDYLADRIAQAIAADLQERIKAKSS